MRCLFGEGDYYKYFCSLFKCDVFRRAVFYPINTVQGKNSTLNYQGRFFGVINFWKYFVQNLCNLIFIIQNIKNLKKTRFSPILRHGSQPLVFKFKCVIFLPLITQIGIKFHILGHSVCLSHFEILNMFFCF